MISRLFAALAGVTLLAAPAAAQVTKVKFMAPHPAKAGEAAKLKRVAVLDFKGGEGDRFAATLLAEMRSALFNNEPYFDVVGAEGVVAEAPPPPPPPVATKGRKAVSTIKVIPNADSQVARALRIGRAARVDGVLIGDVQAARELRNYTESRTGENNSTVQVPCTATTINFTVTPKMINVATGQVVYSRTINSRDTMKICAGKVDRGVVGNMVGSVEDMFGGLFKGKPKRGELAAKTSDQMKVESELDLITKVVKAAAEEIVEEIAPYNYETEVAFYADSPKLAKDVRTQFKNAATFAKASRFDRACAEWLNLKTPETEQNVQLLFNLASCAAVETPDEPAEALRLLKQAESLVPTYNKDIDSALQRLQKAVANSGELKKQIRGN